MTGPDDPAIVDRVDVIVVGAGVAGLSAALLLGRCGHSVVLCDAGQPRNATASRLHGFLSRDGIAPAEMVAVSREQLAAYPSVSSSASRVVRATRDRLGFAIELENGERLASRRLLVATGMVDELPEIPGVRELLGRSVFTCPICDGWEVRDQPVGVIGSDQRAVDLAHELSRLCRDILLCTEGREPLAATDLARLQPRVWVREERVVGLVEAGTGVHVLFESGGIVPRSAIFVVAGQRQPSSLLADLGCMIGPEGSVRMNDHEAHAVPGLFVAGDAAGRGGLAILASADAARAALSVHASLLREDLAGWQDPGCCGWPAAAIETSE